MHPIVSERTSNLVASVITCAAAICSVYYEELPVDYGILFGLISMIAAVIGMRCQGEILRKSGGRYSILVLMLFVMVLVTFVGTTALNLVTITEKAKAGLPILKFKSYC